MFWYDDTVLMYKSIHWQQRIEEWMELGRWRKNDVPVRVQAPIERILQALFHKELRKGILPDLVVRALLVMPTPLPHHGGTARSLLDKRPLVLPDRRQILRETRLLGEVGLDEGVGAVDMGRVHHLLVQFLGAQVNRVLLGPFQVTPPPLVVGVELVVGGVGQLRALDEDQALVGRVLGVQVRSEVLGGRVPVLEVGRWVGWVWVDRGERGGWNELL